MKVNSGFSTFQANHKTQVNTNTINSGQLNKHSVSIDQKAKSVSVQHFLNNLKASGGRLLQRISSSITSLKTRVITQFKPVKPIVLLDPKDTGAKGNMKRFDTTECKEHSAIMPGRLHANKIAFNNAEGQKIADTFAIAAQFPKPDQLEDHLLTLFNMRGGVVSVLASTEEMIDSAKGKDPELLKQLKTEEGLNTNYDQHEAYDVSRKVYKSAAMVNYFSGFDTQDFGRFRVKSKKVDSSDLEAGKEKGVTLNKYELTLKDNETGATSKVTVMHFDNWPDFGAPEVGVVSQMVDLIENQNAESGHPPMVHCLAGVGRTALVIGGLGLKHSNDHGLGMDHKEVIQSMRTDRSNQMLETQKQINVLEQYQNQLGIQTKTTTPDIAPSDDKGSA